MSRSVRMFNGSDLGLSRLSGHSRLMDVTGLGGQTIDHPCREGKAKESRTRCPKPQPKQPATTQEPAPTTTSTDGQEQLGEAGKAALDAEREARQASDKRAKQLERELEQQRKAGMSEAEKAIAEAEKRGREEAHRVFGERLVRSEFATAAARRNPDFKTNEVLDDLNLARFVGEDGEPDIKAIEKAVERLVPIRHLNIDGPWWSWGPLPSSGQSDMTKLIRKAAGRA